MTVSTGNRSAIPAPRRGSGVFERARTVTEPALRAAIDSLPPATRRAVGYHFGWWDSRGNLHSGTPGKALRPALVLVAAEAVGGTPVGMAAVAAVPAAIPAAVAVELMHNFTLLHDDVLDGDGLRRHRPAVWKAFGTGAAILAGDALVALAFDVLAATAHPSASTAARLLGATVAQLVEGQADDLSFDRRDDVRLDECFRMARRKTGALLECSAGLGGLFGGGTPAQIAALRGFGVELGLAFQLTDDLLGIWGGVDATGKPAHSDLKHRKRSLPVVAALAAGGATADRIRDAYRATQEMSDVEAQELAGTMDAAGWRDWCRSESRRHLRVALDLLEPAITTERRQDLRAIARLVGDRDR
ncbi:polyprenyl synthetase family protein [Asanoa sp. WMMD1127]|uniref:polyprenyl synthetase family protein n=1 Tax=Asanoa sp. WMMD1127 TaxID=3016107 RepID=UPI002417747D|nr:polyprenyl synthetase family protein [Asanoa sp. WMMD1127]MDG4820932.1 polyprenyl synthetase family protein [Asanoa sp. WMMD1127]